jgi:integrase
MPLIGGAKLKELTAADVRSALAQIATSRSTRAVQMAHNSLVRVIRYAEANDLVGRNAAALVTTPPQGLEGRPSRSLTLGQAQALIKAAEASRLRAYVVLSLLTGCRTEEARALAWDHVDLEGDPDAEPPIPPNVAVWRSVRSHGDGKTRKSRRTLRLPMAAVEALRAHKVTVRWPGRHLHRLRYARLGTVRTGSMVRPPLVRHRRARRRSFPAVIGHCPVTDHGCCGCGVAVAGALEPAGGFCGPAATSGVMGTGSACQMSRQ